MSGKRYAEEFKIAAVKQVAQRGQLFTLFAFANLVLAGRRFTITESRSPS